MKRTEIRKLHGFFENELKNRILSFWMPRCEDKEYGGFLNCFDNKGLYLIGAFTGLFITLITVIF